MLVCNDDGVVCLSHDELERILDDQEEGFQWISATRHKREMYSIEVFRALTAVYSATKAALHSYVLSQRYKLKASSVGVLEISPPWVQTDLLNSKEEPRAMPLKEFMEETIKILGTDAEEIVVEQAKSFRNNPGPKESALVTQFNDTMIPAAPQ